MLHFDIFQELACPNVSPRAKFLSNVAADGRELSPPIRKQGGCAGTVIVLIGANSTFKQTILDQPSSACKGTFVRILSCFLASHFLICRRRRNPSQPSLVFCR
jgi:hypothetical protein